jgi:hypothetical protein
MIFITGETKIAYSSRGERKMSSVFIMPKRLFRGSIILIAAILLLFPVEALSEGSTDTYVVIGSGLIYKENISAARNQAIANSLVSAVGRKAAELLPVEALMTHHETLDEILYEKISKFVKDYKVLTESSSEDNYRVIVQATVKSANIKRELSNAGIIVGKKAMPSILFFIAEQKLMDITPRYWWGKGMTFVKPSSEQSMTEALREKGFQIIEHGPRVQRLAFGMVENSPDLNNQEAVDLGSQLNADVIVMGRAIASSAPNVMGGDIKSFKGMITARVLRTTTGEEIAAVSRTAVTANVDEIDGSRDALSGAGSLLAEDLAEQIVTAWQKEAKEAFTVIVYLDGTRNLANFVMFRRMLAKLSNVEEIQVKELKSNNATLEVEYKGKSKELADAMMLHAFETFGINIYEVTPEHLKVELTPNKPASIN